MDKSLRTVGIVIFDEVEVLDFAGPFEVFSVARRPEEDRDDAGQLFQAVTIAQETHTIRCIGGLRVEPMATFTDHPPLDILLVPGGRGTRRERLNPAMIDWIREQDVRSELTLSVCTGSLLLAEAGLLAGKKATTHWSVTELMQQLYPQVRVLEQVRYVDEGKVVTSAGISAGIDMSLYVVARLWGEATAHWTARRMEYDWRPGTEPAAAAAV